MTQLKSPPRRKKVKSLPPRSKVKPADTWDLTSLFDSDAAWETAFTKCDKLIEGYAKYQGHLADEAKTLSACLKHDRDFDRLCERLSYYAFLKGSQDKADNRYQAMQSRFRNMATRAAEASSFIRPEVLALSQAKLKQYMQAPVLKEFRLALERLLRYKPHTLSPREEQLLAMQGEMADTAHQTFDQLLNSDLKFGSLKNEKGEEVELSNSSISAFLISPLRRVRRQAFHQYYDQFAAHENTLASTLAGSIYGDVYYARARGYDSALSAALFPDNMPPAVYDNLISSVRGRLPALHRYYDVRRRKMKLRDIHAYDTSTPILTGQEIKHTWQQAVKVIMRALEPLGQDYCSVLEEGLTGRWCDRYPNQGKSSGAFSAGSFDGDPYILMNYQPTVLRDVFTLAHEAGHSMHSYYSSKHQPFQYYNYVIFVAEVASTFNEQLLRRYMLASAKSDEQRAYLINHEIDDIRSTIFRQTMFAEFEKITHAMAEAGEPLTVSSFKDTYHKLLVDYFGPDFVLDPHLDLECFRIPHYYRAFYVYKYATGMSAAIALAERVLSGGPSELNDYLSFLRGGCSKDPLDLLRDAGVDMQAPQPVDTALAHFEDRVAELDELI